MEGLEFSVKNLRPYPVYNEELMKVLSRISR